MSCPGGRSESGARVENPIDENLLKKILCCQLPTTEAKELIDDAVKFASANPDKPERLEWLSKRVEQFTIELETGDTMLAPTKDDMEVWSDFIQYNRKCTRPLAKDTITKYSRAFINSNMYVGFLFSCGVTLKTFVPQADSVKPPEAPLVPRSLFESDSITPEKKSSLGAILGHFADYLNYKRIQVEKYDGEWMTYIRRLEDFKEIVKVNMS